jgi:hypothetical protein
MLVSVISIHTYTALANGDACVGARIVPEISNDATAIVTIVIAIDCFLLIVFSLFNAINYFEKYF